MLSMPIKKFSYSISGEGFESVINGVLSMNKCTFVIVFRAP